MTAVRCRRFPLPTASMTPELEILDQQTPSPVTPLGAKGVAEGNSRRSVCSSSAGPAAAMAERGMGSVALLVLLRQ
jgi:2-furoyl-CoA dehydrogenase large subunit